MNSPNELAATLAAAARRHSERIAVVDPSGRRTSYGELDRGADEVAAWLQARGLEPGALLALCLPASTDHLLLMLGAARAGVAFSACNPRHTEHERSDSLAVLAPDLVVGTPELLPDWAGCPVVEVALDEQPGRAVRDGHRPPRPVASDPDRPVAVVLTSGTTGTPKGAVFTDRQIQAIRRMDVGETWGGAGDMLVSTELCHVGIATKLAWYLRLGATMHLLARWRAKDVLDRVEQYRMRSIGGISSQFALLLREPDLDRRDLSCVTSLVAGGGPSAPALVREARERFGAPYSIRYSSTESGGIGCGTAFDAPDQEALHTVGRPRTGVEVRVDERQVVWLRSAAVMARYHRDPARTAKVLVDGWLRTSDRGHLDEQGRLVLLGRTGDSWVRGGHNVHPQPVEAVLADHPRVREVAVVPRADPVMGHVGVAFVVPRDLSHPPRLEELRRFAVDRVARHALPEDLQLVEVLPRTGTDKIDRAALAERV